ncbi:MAG: acetylmuramidase [Rhizobiales bacterium PAR1]|nr:MAG: acetylmuramidase [Rhizobiales bacterium PAR1]
MASESFEPALTCVLAQEGGYSDHPADPGGATMMGITQGTLAEWRGNAVTKADVRALSRTEVAEIYRKRYWDSVHGDQLPAGLDLAVFDFAVNSGVSRAVRSLQRVLGVAADGRVGPETLQAVAICDPGEMVTRLSALRLAFLEALSTFPVFGRGWTRRVREVEAEARKLVSALSVTPARLPSTTKELAPMDITKGILTSRTVWANAIGIGALALSWLGFDTSGLDKGALTDSLLQALAGVSFVASTMFRILATKRLDSRDETSGLIGEPRLTVLYASGVDHGFSVETPASWYMCAR